MITAYFALLAAEFLTAVGMAVWGALDIEAASKAIPAFAVAAAVLCTAQAVWGAIITTPGDNAGDNGEEA